MSRLIVPALFLISISLVACQQSRQLRNMDSATNQMNLSTGEMNGTMRDMSGKIEDVGSSTGEMRKQMQDMNAMMTELVSIMRTMNDTMKTMDRRMERMTASILEMSSKFGDLLSTMRNMDSNLTDLRAAIGSMDAKLLSMIGRLDEVYETARPALAKFLRSNSRRQLDASQSLPGKLAAAALYHMAFEFQLWSGEAIDTLEKREDLAVQAVNEFYREIHDYLPNDLSDVSPLDQASKRLSLHALAATMHMRLSKQDQVIARNRSLQSMSLLTLTEGALRKRNDLKSGRVALADLPKVTRDLLFYERAAIHVIRVRMNFLVTMGIGMLSPVRESWMGLPTGFVRTRFFEWSVQSSNLNSSELEQASGYLGAAIDAQRLLAEIGEPYALHSDLESLLGNLAASTVRPEQTQDHEKGEFLRKIHDQFSALRQRSR